MGQGSVMYCIPKERNKWKKKLGENSCLHTAIKIDFKNIIDEIYANGDSQLNQEDCDSLKFIYDWYIIKGNDLSCLQKINLIKIRGKIEWRYFQ